MLKTILKLDGAHKLDKSEQHEIKGGWKRLFIAAGNGSPCPSGLIYCETFGTCIDPQEGSLNTCP